MEELLKPDSKSRWFIFNWWERHWLKLNWVKPEGIMAAPHSHGKKRALIIVVLLL